MPPTVHSAHPKSEPEPIAMYWEFCPFLLNPFLLCALHWGRSWSQDVERKAETKELLEVVLLLNSEQTELKVK